LIFFLAVKKDQPPFGLTKVTRFFPGWTSRKLSVPWFYVRGEGGGLAPFSVLFRLSPTGSNP